MKYRYRFSLAKSHNLLQKTDKEPAIAERRTQEEKPLSDVKSLKGGGGGVSQAKEKKAFW